MENVLRAMDVIPPFGSHSAPGRLGVKGVPDNPSAPMSAVKGPPNDRGIPTLDLGEKILAEQRRQTARKRRAPGDRDVVEDAGCEREETPRHKLVEPTSDELAQLQGIVADIVARDIERLCARLSHVSRDPVRSSLR